MTTYSSLVFAMMLPESDAPQTLKDFILDQAMADIEENQYTIRSLISADAFDLDAYWDSLKDCTSDEVLEAAWHARAPRVSVAEWEEAIATLPLTSRVIKVARMQAPLHLLSPAHLASLINVPATGKLNREHARRVVERNFRHGMEDVWRRALVNLPPHKIPYATLNQALKPITDGLLTEVPSAAPALYRVAAACLPTSTPGTLAKLLAESSRMGSELNIAQFHNHAQDWRRQLAAVLPGRREDLEALHQLRIDAGNLSANVPGSAVESALSREEREAFDSGSVFNQLWARDFNAALPDGVNAYVEIWRRLADEDRTDEVCTFILAEEAPLELHREVIAHLGERAEKVCRDSGLLHQPRGNRELSAWVADIDVDAWADLFSQAEQPQVTATSWLQAVPDAARERALALLLERPEGWQMGPLAAVTMLEEFTDEHWAQLTPAQVVNVGIHNPASRDWLARTLGADPRVQNPAVWEALKVSLDADVRAGDLFAGVASVADTATCRGTDHVTGGEIQEGAA